MLINLKEQLKTVPPRLGQVFAYEYAGKSLYVKYINGANLSVYRKFHGIPGFPRILNTETGEPSLVIMENMGVDFESITKDGLLQYYNRTTIIKTFAEIFARAHNTGYLLFDSHFGQYVINERSEVSRIDLDGLYAFKPQNKSQKNRVVWNLFMDGLEVLDDFLNLTETETEKFTEAYTQIIKPQYLQQINPAKLDYSCFSRKSQTTIQYLLEYRAKY